MKKTINRTHREKIAPKTRRSWPNDPLEDPAQKRSLVTSDPDRLGRELTALSALSVEHLKNRWRSLYGTEPPRTISRVLLTRVIAYRLQERAFGGLKPSTRRLLERIAEGGSSPADAPRALPKDRSWDSPYPGMAGEKPSSRDP